MPGTSPRINESVKAAIEPDQRPRLESPQLQRVVVQYCLRFGVGCEQYLKAAIEQKTVDLIRVNTTSNPCSRLV